MKTKIIQHPKCQLPAEQTKKEKETQKTLKKSPLFKNKKNK